MAPAPKSFGEPSTTPTRPPWRSPYLLPTPKRPRRPAFDNTRYPTGPLKPRLVAAFTIDHPAKEPFDSGLDQLMRLMRSRSTAAGAAAQGSKLGKEMYDRLDGRVREAVAGFSVKIELSPPVWMDPQYGLAVLVWAFEELQRWRVECGGLKDVLGKIVMAAREMEDQDAPLMNWTDEKPW
ncbi:MAG: hypothetical protein LQ349_008167 [Xanthoria aureola]|nr:MAG: hypothetical protein LQ349_008167 [Xanthoria aureola]